MKLTLTLAFCLVYLSSVRAGETHTCLNRTDPSGVISHTFGGSGSFERCWMIIVPEGSYVRLNLTEANFKDATWCSTAHVKFIDVRTKEEYEFCTKDKEHRPITFLNDVMIMYYANYLRYVMRTSFKVHYSIESLICVQNNHYRCSEHQCIYKHQVCNGVEDCKNGADEVSCETGVTAIKGVNDSRENAVTWLKKQRSDTYGWGKNTHRAIVALYLSGAYKFLEGAVEENLMAQKLELQTAIALLRNSSVPLSVNDLSMYINALSVTCHNVRQFYGQDLLRILAERLANWKSPVPGAYLTLCNGNWTFTEFQIRRLLNVLDNHSGYLFHIDIQAMSLMALTCIKNKKSSFNNIENATEIYNATVKQFISRQNEDGSFGNVYTTALVTQALLSSGQENYKGWDFTSTIEYLMMELNSTSIDFLSAYFVTPILSGKNLVDIGDVTCGKPRKQGEDEEISEVINKFGEKIQVKYDLYVGDIRDVAHSIYLRMPENCSAYDVMRVAEVADPKYKFLHTDMSGHVYVYEIAGITNDPEAGKFWLLFSTDSSGNGTLGHYIQSPDKEFLNDGDHLIMWYKTAHF